MPQKQYDASTRDLRRFAVVQLVLTATFCGLVFWLLGGIREQFPPYWLVATALVPVVGAVFLSERVWMYGDPVDPRQEAAAQRTQGIGAFAGQTVRKLIYCETPIIMAVLAAFVTPYGGWLVATTAPVGLLVMAWEVWPSLRSAANTEAMLNSRGAQTGLVESLLNK